MGKHVYSFGMFILLLCTLKFVSFNSFLMLATLLLSVQIDYVILESLKIQLILIYEKSGT